MADAPTNIRALREAGRFEIDWPDAGRWAYPFRLMRQLCPCAACVDEFTGVRTLDPESVPVDIVPVEVGFSGNYALRIQWNDGHHTGLFTWEHLARMRDEGAVVELGVED